MQEPFLILQKTTSLRSDFFLLKLIDYGFLIYYRIYVNRYLILKGGKLDVWITAIIIWFLIYFFFHHRDQLKVIPHEFDKLPKHKTW